jgi:hypothetical protein
VNRDDRLAAAFDDAMVKATHHGAMEAILKGAEV